MFKFKKKKQTENVSDDELQKAMDNHLELINDQLDLIDKLINDMSNMNKLVIEHKKAIDNLQDTTERLQKLIK